MKIPSRAWGFVRVGRNGAFGVRVPEFGTGGPDGNPLDNDADAGDEAAGVEFCPVFASQPSSGTLTVWTDGSLSLVGAADGTYVLPYDLYTFTPGESASVDEGSTTYTVTVGSAAAEFTATLDAGYAVQAQHTATLDAAYGIEAQHTATLAAGYAVQAQHAASLDAGYAVQSAHLAQLAAGYAVQAQHTATLDAGYTVEAPAGVFTATLDAGYAVQAQHTAVLDAGFDIQASHSATLSAGYAVRASYSALLAAGYAVQAQHTATLDAGYAVAYPAGSGDPEAIWEGFALESGLTPGAMLRIVMAAVAGRTDGIGTNTERYFSADGSKPRITATFDSAGNRTTIVLDGSP